MAALPTLWNPVLMSLPDAEPISIFVLYRHSFMPKTSRVIAILLVLSASVWTVFAAKPKDDGIDRVDLAPNAKNDGAINHLDTRSLSQHPNLPAGAIYTDPKATPEARANDVVSRLTFDEKLELTGGTGSRCYPGIERLGLRTVHLQNASQGIGVDLEPAQLAKQEKSTAFPCTEMLAATWNDSLAKEYGRALSEECRALYVDILEGPGINLYRHASGGRNFEYLGEDPLLASRLVVNYVQGLQSLKTIATVKHFIVNDQDCVRHVANVTVSERALHEIYLPPFVAAITEADAGAIMTGNNAVNNWPGAANQPLVRDFLRAKLGFQGMVMSDFSNCMFWLDRRNLIFDSGHSLVMPKNALFVEYVRQLITDHPDQKTLAEKALDTMVYENLYTLFKFGVYDRPSRDLSYLKTFPAHKEVALRTAEEGITLLKNADHVLPIDGKQVKHILLTGSSEALTAYVGRGSGSVVGYDRTDYPTGLKKIYGDKVSVSASPTDAEVRQADVVLFFIEKRAGEGRDIPFEQPEVTDQVNHLAALNPNLVVIFSGGTAFAMPWLPKAKGLIFAFLGGQESGNALANVISGKTNPSGRLPFTIEKNFADGPGKNYNLRPDGKLEWGGAQADSKKYQAQFGQFEIAYNEGVFAGYRWYDAKHIEPQFPFGFGLSYTTFEFKNLKISADKLSASAGADQTVMVELDVTNTGKRVGKEVVQLYVGDPSTAAVPQPPKQLRAYAKVDLQSGETGHVQLKLDRRAFAYWNETTHDWAVLPGEYQIMAGDSSRDLLLQTRLTVN